MLHPPIKTTPGFTNEDKKIKIKNLRLLNAEFLNELNLSISALNEEKKLVRKLFTESDDDVFKHVQYTAPIVIPIQNKPKIIYIHLLMYFFSLI